MLLSIVAGTCTIIYSIVLNFYVYIVEKRRINKWSGIFLILSISIYFIILIIAIFYYYINNEEGRGYYALTRLGSILITIFWLFSIRQDIINWPNIPRLEILSGIFLVFLSIYIFGTTYGLSVRFSTNHSDVWVKDAQSLHDATIILLLSHHSIFLAGKMIVTIPSSNVIRIAHTIE
jgi:hypothetical protein